MNRSAFWPKGPEPWYTPYSRHRPARPARSDGPRANAASTSCVRHRPARPARSDGPRANAASTTYSRHAWPFQNPKSKIQNPKSRPAFTLVELLVTITIITMLAGLTLGGLRMARTAAREIKTRSTVAKLDEIIMRMYAGYEHRRVPIDTSGMTRAQAIETRYYALRDIIRMEMPDSFAEIDEGPQVDGIGQPALHAAYQAAQRGSPDHESARCLYLIVSTAHPRELQHFNPNEIDVHGGVPVFVDGWGNPICFQRWPAGFDESDIQSPNAEAGSEEFIRDPFDPHGVSNEPRLLPLIYSWGSGGEEGAIRIHNHWMDVR